MRFERVRRHVRIVAPDLRQQGLAAHHLAARAIEIAQDRRFLLGQLELGALLVGEQLRARPERVGPDLEDRVLAGLVLAQLGADAGEQHRELERLHHIVVGAGFQAHHRVVLGCLPGQHDDRAAEAVAPHLLDGVPSVHVRQAHIHDGKIDPVALDGLQRARRRIGDRRPGTRHRGRAARRGYRAGPDRHPRRGGGSHSTSRTFQENKARNRLAILR